MVSSTRETGMNKKVILAITLLFTFVATDLAIAAEKKKDPRKGWPEEVQEIQYPSSADNTPQPAMFYAPQTDKPVPLLVGLHSWGANYLQGVGAGYAKWCIENKWVLIHPNFRGKNNRPEAMGSELVVKDILSAVKYAKKNTKVDENRIYVIGWSGGGYASMLIAGRSPEIWAGVSSWCGISDLVKWHAETSATTRIYYARQIEMAIGGNPQEDKKAAEECRIRSAITYVKNAANIPFDINAGMNDNIVPVSQSLDAFNALAAEKDRLTADQIKFFVEKKKVPDGLQFKAGESDSSYVKRKVLFRRKSNNVRVTIFEGGHQIFAPYGLAWLNTQKKSAKPEKSKQEKETK